MDLKEYAKSAEKLKKLRALARPQEKAAPQVKPRKTTEFLARITPKKAEKVPEWKKYVPPQKVQVSDSPFDIANKLHQLPDGFLDKRLIGLDIEELFKEFVSRIQKKKLIDVSHVGNMQQFIFGRTKYKVEELMHGGGSSSSSGSTLETETPVGTVNDANTTFTVSHEPFYINVNGAIYNVGTGLYQSYVGGTITLSAPVGTGGFIVSYYQTT